MSPEQATLLLTGATGFVGGALLECLRDDENVRCLVRDASKLGGEGKYQSVEADLSDLESLRPALEGIEHVYYLVHSMEPGASDGFAEADRTAAQNFAEIAKACGVQRVIYLGGVSSDGSDHLESRAEVEEILRGASSEFVGLRASMIVGAGSASFGTLVQLVDRLPVLVMPSWRDQKSQPVAIDDVVGALVAARDVEPGTYDIAGPDTITFEEMTEVVSELLGQKHRSVGVPFSNSAAEATLASAVVDEDIELLRPLMSGLHSDLVVRENSLESVFGITPTPFREAATAAIAD